MSAHQNLYAPDWDRRDAKARQTAHENEIINRAALALIRRECELFAEALREKLAKEYPQVLLNGSYTDRHHTPVSTGYTMAKSEKVADYIKDNVETFIMELSDDPEDFK